mgnify:CR=1 FL=1
MLGGTIAPPFLEIEKKTLNGGTINTKNGKLIYETQGSIQKSSKAHAKAKQTIFERNGLSV